MARNLRDQTHTPKKVPLEDQLFTSCATHRNSCEILLPSLYILLSERWQKVKTRIWAALLAAAMLPVCASGQQCKQIQFTGTISSQESYSHSFAPNLMFRLTPMKHKWGWVISISPKDSDEDWSYPVTFPIRTGESHTMGTGYGSTVQEKLAYPTSVQFVLTHAEFLQYSKMATDTLESPRSEAAGEYISKVASLSKGQVIVEVLKYGKGDTADTVKWMSFKVSILVPVTFQAPNTSWEPTPCRAAGK